MIKIPHELYQSFLVLVISLAVTFTVLIMENVQFVFISVPMMILAIVLFALYMRETL